MRLRLAILAAILLNIAGCQDNYTVDSGTGRLVDASTGAPIARAAVYGSWDNPAILCPRLEGGCRRTALRMTTHTDDEGYFTFPQIGPLRAYKLEKESPWLEVFKPGDFDYSIMDQQCWGECDEGVHRKAWFDKKTIRVKRYPVDHPSRGSNAPDARQHRQDRWNRGRRQLEGGSGKTHCEWVGVVDWIAAAVVEMQRFQDKRVLENLEIGFNGALYEPEVGPLPPPYDTGYMSECPEEARLLKERVEYFQH